jgi:hypothetical protein
MGLARIAIAVLAVVVAFGLLIIGGIALWGALTSKDGEKPNAASPSPSSTANAGETQPNGHASQVGNSVEVRCLAAQCKVFVSGPGAEDIVFNNYLRRNERYVFNETRLVVRVWDASAVTVTINGQQQPRGTRGQAKTYEVPASQ